MDNSKRVCDQQADTGACPHQPGDCPPKSMSEPRLPTSNQNTQDLCVIPDCLNARLELSDFCEQHFRAFGEQETSHTETKAVPLKVYEGAVHGRKEFRRSYRGALELLRKFVAAWEGRPGHENMDRLCEIARNFDGSSQETQHDLPESLRDPVKNIERGRELLQKWGPTPVTDAALSGNSSAVETKESPPWFFEYQALVSACMAAGFRPDKEDDPNYGGKRTVLVPLDRPSIVETSAPHAETCASRFGNNACNCHVQKASEQLCDCGEFCKASLELSFNPKCRRLAKGLPVNGKA